MYLCTVKERKKIKKKSVQSTQVCAIQKIGLSNLFCLCFCRTVKNKKNHYLTKTLYIFYQKPNELCIKGGHFLWSLIILVFIDINMNINSWYNIQIAMHYVEKNKHSLIYISIDHFSKKFNREKFCLILEFGFRERC